MSIPPHWPLFESAHKIALALIQKVAEQGLDNRDADFQALGEAYSLALQAYRDRGLHLSSGMLNTERAPKLVEKVLSLNGDARDKAYDEFKTAIETKTAFGDTPKTILPGGQRLDISNGWPEHGRSYNEGVKETIYDYKKWNSGDIDRPGFGRNWG